MIIMLQTYEYIYTHGIMNTLKFILTILQRVNQVYKKKTEKTRSQQNSYQICLSHDKTDKTEKRFCRVDKIHFHLCLWHGQQSQ